MVAPDTREFLELLRAMVARIRIPRQAVGDAVSMQQCEQSAFNPWHCLADHRPLGGMNRARRDIYAAMSRFRIGESARP
jgi:hypothetical protein